MIPQDLKKNSKTRGLVMKKILLLLVVAVALGACSYNGKPRKNEFNSPLCGPVKGFTVGYVIYGDSKLVMIPISKVRSNTAFVVGLKPLDGFAAANVIVKGTGAAAWINAQGKYDDPRVMPYPKHAFEVGCVPEAAAGTTFKFEVKVEMGDVTNSLDPRAEVVLW